MNLARLAVQNKAIMQVLLVLVLLGGILAYGRLGRLEDPEFTIKEAVIYTQYPGATAEQVELEVTEPIETAVQQLKQLKEVRSISRAGLSIVFAEIKEVYDKETLPQVWDELRRKVGHAGEGLPPGCCPPMVNDDFGDVYGVYFALTGDGYSQHDLREIALDLRRELLLCRDVGRIDFWGLQPEVVYIEIDRVRLAQLGLDPTVLFNAIRQQNAMTDAGKVAVGSEDVRLRVSGDYTDVDELAEQLVQGGPDGRMIRLKDIARIERGYLDPPVELLQWNGQDAVGIGISTVSGGDVIAMGNSIARRLEQLKGRVPLGVEVHSIAHQSETVEKATRGFVLNLVAAVAIVMLLLVLFMGLREGFIISVVLLLTILATFLCMDAMGITLQRISLGALIIALGMLVDNAIVVAEGIVIKSRCGQSRAQAAEETVRETQWPLLGATGIAILAFAAITLSKDMTGEWLKSLFQVICISLGLSWVFAITVTPYLCVAILPERLGCEHEPRGNRFARGYRRFVGLCIDHRRISLAAVGALLMVAMWGFGFVRQDFMPDMNRPQITVDIWMPEGTHISQTADEAAAVSDYIRTLDGVEDVASFVGRGPLRFLLTYEPQMPSSAYGQLLVTLDDYQKIPALRSLLTAYLNEHHPRAVTSVDAFKLGPGGGAVVARLSGPDGEVLRELAGKVKAVMGSHENARSIRTDWGEPVKVQTVCLSDARAREAGLGRTAIARSLAMNFSGANVGVYRQDDDLLPIVLRPPCEQRHGIGNIGDIQVWSGARQDWIPIEQVTDGRHVEWETPVVHRLNRMRVLRVFCKQIHGTTDSLLRQLRPSIEAIDLPEGYTLEWGGEHEEQVEANSKLMSNVPIAFAAMFLISVLLFNTLRHPLIIFLGLPLAVIGVAAGMLLADKPFGFMAMLGFLSLSGMLIKNEIVLLDQINIELAAGKKPYRAVLDSAAGRVRPVCMAAFTTVLGMTPLLWDAFFAPMAVTIMGGLAFATVLTLVVVPVLYSTFFKVYREEVSR
ncbi:efflux RND transporter permease subunit [Tichowtungia aerotolerans]|uniref:AcrB/AcrD/AcrF family protein n=1 Tax=Tichowtungia aerotolerans TaxID=2697043 RepID=A0A6P1MB23_9BACT|nr:efflux RND transporter permease subunit [Tichowtungia aerotolerans]QHI68315.1 AcrB/AcrD/AcrF family protein [Tichowtungia aerotolerans]